MTNVIDKKKYFVVNRFDGSVTVVVSRNRFRAMQKGRMYFGQVALDLYTC